MDELRSDIGQYWKIIVDTFSDGLLVVDTMGRIITANRAGRKNDRIYGRRA